MNHQILFRKYFHQDINWRKLKEPEPARFPGLGKCVKEAVAEDAQRRGRPMGVEAMQGQGRFSSTPAPFISESPLKECKLTQCSVWAPHCAGGPPTIGT